MPIWRALRERWIDWHTDSANGLATVMEIPGVDKQVFANGSNIRLQNRKSGECLTATEGGLVMLRKCDGTPRQLFQLNAFEDGKLTAAVVLKDAKNRFLRTQSPAVLQDDDSDKHFEAGVFSEAPVNGTPSFAERWYLLPLAESVETAGFFSIESDALGRSFLRQNGSRAEMQGFLDDGTNTALPQNRFSGGNDKSLQWRVVPEKGKNG